MGGAITETEKRVLLAPCCPGIRSAMDPAGKDEGSYAIVLQAWNGNK